MATETRSRRYLYPPHDIWPPDDTEESIVGTDWHQMTITNLRLGINEVAHLRHSPDQPLPWQALSQIPLLGCERPTGDSYRTMPDIFVYPHPIDQNRGSVALALDGPPVLIVEVLSESTYAADIDHAHGKGYSYARAGVREYMVIDPLGAFLPERVRAWRLSDGVYHPWEPDASAQWRSNEIAVAIGLEGTLATVYTLDGRRQLREGEIAKQGEELLQKDAEIAELRRRLRELGHE